MTAALTHHETSKALFSSLVKLTSSESQKTLGNTRVKQKTQCPFGSRLFSPTTTTCFRAICSLSRDLCPQSGPPIQKQKGSFPPYIHLVPSCDFCAVTIIRQTAVKEKKQNQTAQRRRTPSHEMRSQKRKGNEIRTWWQAKGDLEETARGYLSEERLDRMTFPMLSLSGSTTKCLLHYLTGRVFLLVSRTKCELAALCCKSVRS